MAAKVVTSCSRTSFRLCWTSWARRESKGNSEEIEKLKRVLLDISDWELVRASRWSVADVQRAVAVDNLRRSSPRLPHRVLGFADWLDRREWTEDQEWLSHGISSERFLGSPWTSVPGHCKQRSERVDARRRNLSSLQRPTKSYRIFEKDENSIDEFIEQCGHFLVATFAGGWDGHQSGMTIAPIRWKRALQSLIVSLRKVDNSRFCSIVWTVLRI